MRLGFSVEIDTVPFLTVPVAQDGRHGRPIVTDSSGLIQSMLSAIVPMVSGNEIMGGGEVSIHLPVELFTLCAITQAAPNDCLSILDVVARYSNIPRGRFSPEYPAPGFATTTIDRLQTMVDDAVEGCNALRQENTRLRAALAQAKTSEEKP